jgi:hypothetical protein
MNPLASSAIGGANYLVRAGRRVQRNLRVRMLLGSRMPPQNLPFRSYSRSSCSRLDFAADYDGRKQMAGDTVCESSLPSDESYFYDSVRFGTLLHAAPCTCSGPGRN